MKMKRIILFFEMLVAALMLVAPGGRGAKAGFLRSFHRQFVDCTASAHEFITVNGQPRTHQDVTYGPEGGTGTVTVSFDPGYPDLCTWTVEKDVSWIGISQTQTHFGGDTFSFTVAQNPLGPRDGFITITYLDDGRHDNFQIRQLGVVGACDLVSEPDSQVFSSAGGEGGFVFKSLTQKPVPPVFPVLFQRNLDQPEWLHLHDCTPGSAFTVCYTVDPLPITAQAMEPDKPGEARWHDIALYRSKDDFINGGFPLSTCYHKVTQFLPECSLKVLCNTFPYARACQQESPHSSMVLELARNYRDHILARTDRGQRYARLYYQFSPQAVQVMLLNPLLMLRARDLVERYEPVLQSMAQGEGGALTEGDLDEIDAFLTSFAAKSGLDLRDAIEGVRQDMRDPHIQSDLKITVVPGARREMSVLDGLGFGQELPWSLSSTLGILMWALAGRRRKLLMRRARRSLVVALAIAGVMGWSGPMPAAAPCQQEAAAGSHRQSGVWTLSAAPPPAVRKGSAFPGLGPNSFSGGYAATAAGSRWQCDPPESLNRCERSEALQGPLDGSCLKLPLCFEPNINRAGRPARFLARGRGCSFLLEATEVAIKFGQQRSSAGPPTSSANQIVGAARPSADRTSSGAGPAFTGPDFRIHLAGANSAAALSGMDKLPATSNLFTGNDPRYWHAEIPTFAKVMCRDVYPGVDMIYHGEGPGLEYDFTLAPGADPGAIRLAFEGANSILVDAAGDLVLRTAAGEVRQHKPVIYQQSNGARRTISGGYALYSDALAAAGKQDPGALERNPTDLLVGFDVGAYDRSKPLIIDPLLSYSTYLGGSGVEEGSAIAVDSAGNIYVAGLTSSASFPVSAASQSAPGGGLQDAFVVKLDSTGKPVYSTYLGGDGQDTATSIAVDSAGNVYVAGFTESTNFPTMNALQATKNGPFNAFVSKLGPTGSLIYSTYLGGALTDMATAIAVDGSGSAYVAGATTSFNFPTANALQPASAGGADAFLAKLDPSGSKLTYSTYLGGSGEDLAAGIAADAGGNVYLSGFTTSTNFPTASPLQAAYGGGTFDAFVAKVDPTGGHLVYSTYLGGSGEEQATHIAVDSIGAAYVTGETTSSDFPMANPFQHSLAGNSDAFVAKLDPSGAHLIYSTYLGGSGIDGGAAIAVEPGGSAYVTGFTKSTDFPTANPVQQAYGGGPYDAFVTRLNPAGSALEYSTYIGGSAIDAGLAVATDASGNAYVMGLTASTDFPVAVPMQAAYGGGDADVFIARISPGPIISSATANGSTLTVTGSGFDQGAKILVSGQRQKTKNDDQSPSTTLIGKKAAKQIAPGLSVTLRVQNAGGPLSNEFSFTRPAASGLGTSRP